MKKENSNKKKGLVLSYIKLYDPYQKSKGLGDGTEYVGNVIYGANMLCCPVHQYSLVDVHVWFFPLVHHHTLLYCVHLFHISVVLLLLLLYGRYVYRLVYYYWHLFATLSFILLIQSTEKHQKENNCPKWQ